MPTLTETIKQEARKIGFDVVGIARIPPTTPPSSQDKDQANRQGSLQAKLLARLSTWLRQGFHGTMEWMAREPERRSEPQAVLPGCRSILSVGVNYYTHNTPEYDPACGRIAQYAWGEDYHRLFKRRLKQLEKAIQTLAPEVQTRGYADTGPIMEKAWAQEAGLGWIGKHSNLVSTEFGSWLLLGEILMTVELDADEPGTDLCGSCALCINACPTGAITEPYVVDAEKCISYLTIEYRGQAEDIPQEQRTKMGNYIFGCDDCLEVCPFNVHAQPTQEPAFQPVPLTLNPPFRTILDMNKESFHSTFQHSPIRRAKHQGLLRNVRIAQENAIPKTPLTSTPQS